MRLKTPETSVIIFAIVVLAALSTLFIAPGAYERRELLVEGAGRREVVVPGTFEYLDRPEQSIPARLAHTGAMIFQAPIRGFTDPDAAPVIAFVLLIGGTFAVLQKTGAVDAALRRLVSASRKSRLLEIVIIPLCMLLFSLGGAVFGMAEETIPFILIFVPLALALGYDSVTGVAIPFLGSAAGFAGAFFNPFTVGVAQGIAGLPPFSGAEFRFGLWLAVTALTIGFVLWHATRVRRNPSCSPALQTDEAFRREGLAISELDAPFTARQKAVLIVFFAGIALLVWGVLPTARGGLGWYMTEIAALFTALGLFMGAIGNLGANGTARAFMEGLRQLAPTAVIIGLARGILIVLTDAQVIDTILHALASGLGEAGAAASAMAMFAVQTCINFFVPSGSGQAALTMPLMAPLSDLAGLSRQTAVLAFQMGDGFTNMIIPMNPVLMGVLTLARIPWVQWAKWVLPLQLLLFAVGLVVLWIAVRVGY